MRGRSSCFEADSPHAASRSEAQFPFNEITGALQRLVCTPPERQGTLKIGLCICVSSCLPKVSQNSGVCFYLAGNGLFEALQGRGRLRCVCRAGRGLGESQLLCPEGAGAHDVNILWDED